MDLTAVNSGLGSVVARRANLDTSTFMFWRLDEAVAGTAVELQQMSGSSPSPYDGTHYSTAVAAVSNMPFVYARAFSSISGSYIEVPASLMLINNYLHLDFWLKPGSVTTDQIIASRRSYDMSDFHYDGWAVGINSSGNLYLDVRVGGSPPTAYYTVLPIGGYLNTWFHAHVSFDGSYGRIFANGVLGATGALAPSSTINYDTGPSVTMLIGKYFESNRYLQGQLAELRMSNRIRRPWELQNLLYAVRDPQSGFEVEA